MEWEACHLLDIPSDAVKSIRKIYNLDTPQRLDEAIKILEDWIQKQDHFVRKDFSKKYLEKTLIACKGSVEKAKKQIDSICTMRTLFPRFFSTTNIKLELKDTLETFWIIPLPELTKDYYRMALFKVKNKHFTDDIILQYFIYDCIVTEYLRINDYENGYIVILDFREINIFEAVTKLSLVDLQQLVNIVIKGYGARLKGVYFLTTSKAVELLINTIKPFLSDKIFNRIQVVPTVEDLHKVVDKDLLPEEYGGKERSIDVLRDEWLEEVCSEKHVQCRKNMNAAITDESKRRDGKFNEEYMGLPGSFRNLIVD